MASLFRLLCKLYVHLQFTYILHLYGISVVRPINNNYYLSRKNETAKLNSLEFFSCEMSEKSSNQNLDKEVFHLT